MSSKIYVGNLSWNTTDDTLRQAFSHYGQVIDSIVMRDRDTGRSRGFGFVTYGTSDEATAAINALNDQELDGRRIKVNLANTRVSGGGGSAPGFGSAPSGYGGGGYSGGQGYGGYSFPPQGGYYSGAQQGYQGGGYQGGYQGGGYPSGGYGGY